MHLLDVCSIIVQCLLDRVNGVLVIGCPACLSGLSVGRSPHITWWLILILVAVVIAASLVLGFCLFCYRSLLGQ